MVLECACCYSTLVHDPCCRCIPDVPGMQDVEALVHMARRRCADDKAPVRKAGVQLLEVLLLLRAQSMGGAERKMPSQSDIAALEAATGDALVSRVPRSVVEGTDSVGNRLGAETEEWLPHCCGQRLAKMGAK